MRFTLRMVPRTGIAPIFIGSKPMVLSVELTGLVASEGVEPSYWAYETR